MRRVFVVLVVLAAALVGLFAVVRSVVRAGEAADGWGVDFCGAVGAADV